MDKQHQNEVRTVIKGHLKRIFGPPAIACSCWLTFAYSFSAINPKWDYLAAFALGALAFGVLALPFVTLSLFISWLYATGKEKSVACSYFVGWAFAWGILILPFVGFDH